MDGDGIANAPRKPVAWLAPVILGSRPSRPSAPRAICWPERRVGEESGCDDGPDKTRGASADHLAPSTPLIQLLCRRGRVMVAESKAHDRAVSRDSERERNAGCGCPDLYVLAQPGGDLVQHRHAAGDSTRFLPESEGIGPSNRNTSRTIGTKTPTFRMDSHGRFHPRKDQKTL